MAVIETWYKQDLQKAVQVKHFEGSLFSGNANGNRIGIIVTNNGTAASLSGTVSGYVVHSDGTSVPCTGSLSGNRASVLLPAAAYKPGIVFISIFLTSGSTVTTLAAVTAMVRQARTDSQVSPGSAVTDWTQTINAAMQSVVTANAANMAVEYGSLTYPVPMGKHTIYNNLLYRCITPIATAESWTASHWTRVRIADEVSDLKSAITKSKLEETIIDGLSYAQSAYSGSNNNVYIICKKIPEFSRVFFKVDIFANCTFNYGLVKISDGKVVYQNSESLATGINTVYVDYDVTEPVYLYVDRGSSKMWYTATGTIPYNMTNNLSSYPVVGDSLPVSAILNAGFRLAIFIDRNIEKIAENVAETDDYLQSKYISSLPFVYDSSATALGAFMLLQPAEADGRIRKIHFKQGASRTDVEISIYEWTGELSLASFTVKSRTYVNVDNGIALCDIPINEGEYIGVSARSYDVCTWRDVSGGAGFIYQPLSDASRALYSQKYITLSYELLPNESLEGEIVDVFNREYNKKFVNSLQDKIILLEGDSRSSTDYTFYKNTLAKKTGANVITQGASGENASYNASNAYFSRLLSTPHDFSIWLVGGNDTGAPTTIGTFSENTELYRLGEPVVTETDITQDYSGSRFIQAIDHIMRKYKSMFYDFKTLNNGHKPKMVFCSDLPQKRGEAYSPEWNKKINWEKKRLAIMECCEKNNVAFLDLLRLCNFDMSYEPAWTSPTDLTTDNGVYFMDGLHPNKYGADVITSLEVQELMRYIMINSYP